VVWKEQNKIKEKVKLWDAGKSLTEQFLFGCAQFHLVYLVQFAYKKPLPSYLPKYHNFQLSTLSLFT
jgi:hypothetical protein